MKKIAILLSVVIFLFVGIYAVIYMQENIPVTYDGSPEGTDTDVYELMEDPEAYDNSDADGVAAVIVNTDLSQTRAVNNVAAVVFDYRGYDTMGESFILLTAIAGSFIILKNIKGRKEDDDDEE